MGARSTTYHLRMSPAILSELMRLVEFDTVEQVKLTDSRTLLRWLDARGIECHPDSLRSWIVLLACRESGLEFTIPGDPTIPSLQPVGTPQ